MHFVFLYFVSLLVKFHFFGFISTDTLKYWKKDTYAQKTTTNHTSFITKKQKIQEIHFFCISKTSKKWNLANNKTKRIRLKDNVNRSLWDERSVVNVICSCLKILALYFLIITRRNAKERKNRERACKNKKVITIICIFMKNKICLPDKNVVHHWFT